MLLPEICFCTIVLLLRGLVCLVGVNNSFSVSEWLLLLLLLWLWLWILLVLLLLAPLFLLLVVLSSSSSSMQSAMVTGKIGCCRRCCCCCCCGRFGRIGWVTDYPQVAGKEARRTQPESKILSKTSCNSGMLTRTVLAGLVVPLSASSAAPNGGQMKTNSTASQPANQPAVQQL